MAGIVVGAFMPRPDNRVDSGGRGAASVTTPDNSGARRCLVDEINQSGVPRKVFADAIANGDESLFSKMVGGSRPFDLDDFDNLPRETRMKWMKRYGREVIGAQVRDLDVAELNEELLALVDRIATVRRLTEIVGKPHTAKAGARREDEKKAAGW